MRQVRGEGRGGLSGFRTAARLATAARTTKASSVVSLMHPLAMFRRAGRVMVMLARRGTADRAASVPVLIPLVRKAMAMTARPSAPRRPVDGFGDIDPTAAGRAQAASNAVFSRYQGLIDAIATDPSLTPEQRASAIRSLQQQQAAEAGAAYQRIMEEAKAAARVRRRVKKRQR